MESSKVKNKSYKETEILTMGKVMVGIVTGNN